MTVFLYKEIRSFKDTVIFHDNFFATQCVRNLLAFDIIWCMNRSWNDTSSACYSFWFCCLVVFERYTGLFYYILNHIKVIHVKMVNKSVKKLSVKCLLKLFRVKVSKKNPILQWMSKAWFGRMKGKHLFTLAFS